MIRVLESVTIPATETPRLWIDDSPGYPVVFTAELGSIADEGPGQMAFTSQCQLETSPLTGKTVAWIGGGTCLGPRIFAESGCVQTVYEIEPTLAEFCPSGVAFVPGDWRATISGKFDVVIYDLGGDVPYDALAAHLNNGGKILPAVV